MSFMQPMTSYADRWVRIDNKYGEGEVMDADDAPKLGDGETVEELGAGWCARLSAPGYMDRTEWIGPYKTEARAIKALDEAVDLCPTCHEDHEGEDCQNT